MIAWIALSAWAARPSISGEVHDRNGAPLSRAIVSLDPGNLEIVTDREGHFFVDYLRDDDGRRVRLRKKVDYVLEVFKPGFHVYTASLPFRKGALVVEPITMIEETIEVADFPENIDPALYSRPTQSSGATYEGQ